MEVKSLSGRIYTKKASAGGRGKEYKLGLSYQFYQSFTISTFALENTLS